MKTPVSNKRNLQIYQIYFRKQQLSTLDPLFIPYYKDEHEEIEWREYWTFVKNHRKAIAYRGITGYLSWKFESKSGVPAKKFLRFISDNPGFDLYYLNPFPLDAFLFNSVWKQGDLYHPGLTEFTSNLLKKSGIYVNILHQTNKPEQAAYANYWAGNSKFWKTYMTFTQPLAKHIREKLTPEENAYVYSIADPVSNCSHIPFIFERMFTTLLVEHPEIKALAYTYDAEDLRARYSAPARIIYSVLKKNWLRNSPVGWMLIQIILLARKMREKFK